MSLRRDNLLSFILVVSMSILLLTASQSKALPDSEVKKLMAVSPGFRAAEEEILDVWGRLDTATRKRLSQSQVAWIKYHRDEEARHLMNQGYSFAKAYTIVTRRKTEELRTHLSARAVWVQKLTESEYNLLMRTSPAFRDAERELNEVYKQVIARIPERDKKTLTREQYNWIMDQRDQDAARYLAQGYPRDQAYARANRDRAELLRSMLDRSPATTITRLTEAEYNQLMHSSPEFNEAEREMNEVWKQVIARTPESEKKALTGAQYNWVMNQRDQEAAVFLARGYPRDQAYAQATRNRTGILRKKLGLVVAKKSYGKKERDIGLSENTSDVDKDPMEALKRIKLEKLGKPRLVYQSGHNRGVEKIRFSPDGRLMLSTEGDKLILWDFASGKEIWRFKQRVPIGYFDFGFISNGTLVYCLGFEFYILEVGSGRELWNGVADPNKAPSTPKCEISPNSKIFMTISNGEARFYEIETGKPFNLEFSMFSKSGNSTLVNFVCLINDEYALIGEEGNNGIVDTWDIRKGRKIQSFQIHKDTATHLQVSPDGSLAVSYGNDSKIILWETATGKIIESIPIDFKISDSSSFIFSENGKWIFIRDWQSPTTTYLGIFNGILNKFYSDVMLQISSDKILIKASDEEAAILNLKSGQIEKTLFETNDKITCMSITSEKDYIAVGFKNGRISVFDLTEKVFSKDFCGELSPITSFSLSSDSAFAFGNQEGRNFLWDFKKGKRIYKLSAYKSKTVQTVVYKGKLFSCFENGMIKVWDLSSGAQINVWQAHSSRTSSIFISEENNRIFSSGEDSGLYYFKIWDLNTFDEKSSIGPLSGVVKDISPTDDNWVFNGILQNEENNLFAIRIDLRNKEIITLRDLGAWQAKISPNGQVIVKDGMRAWGNSFFLAEDFYSGEQLIDSILLGYGSDVLKFSQDGKIIVRGDFWGDIYLFDLFDLNRLGPLFEGHQAGISGLEISRNGNLFSTSQDGTVRIWDMESGMEKLALMEFKDGTWIVVDPEGRFDTNNLEEIRGAHWIMPDDPFTPLPLELFMRDYYEPDLMRKVMAGENMRPVQPMLDLNRAQPEVEILSVEPNPAKTDTVKIQIKVTGGRKKYLKNGRKVVDITGAHDLKVFRNGKLVTYKDGEITINKKRGFTIGRIDDIRIPMGESEIKFSAFAFNDDGIKSKTHTKVYRPAKVSSKIKGKVYLVSIGVKACELPSLDLNFTANDARVMMNTLKNLFESRSDQYQEVVDILLISDAEEINGQRAVKEKLATKEIIHAVFDLLGGYDVDPAIKSKVPGAKRISRATPSDTVIITVASHGYVDKNGVFYIIPYDVGSENYKAEILKNSINSDDLERSLRDIDAGEIVMIIDACHSAASVHQVGFKPGPMGSRGLGQLAYYKGMRILAATQSDNVALEDKRIEHGFLTYTLVKEGLQKRLADFSPVDRKITMGEWLKYSLNRVPRLQELIDSGKFDEELAEAGARVVVLRARSSPEDKTLGKDLQQPSLFDFTKGNPETVLIGPN